MCALDCSTAQITEVHSRHITTIPSGELTIIYVIFERQILNITLEHVLKSHVWFQGRQIYELGVAHTSIILIGPA